MAVDRGERRRDLFMALRHISQTIFFASRLFSDIHIHTRASERARGDSRQKPKLVFYNNVPVAFEKRIYLFKCHGDSLPRRRIKRRQIRKACQCDIDSLKFLFGLKWKKISSCLHNFFISTFLSNLRADRIKKNFLNQFDLNYNSYIFLF